MDLDQIEIFFVVRMCRCRMENEFFFAEDTLKFVIRTNKPYLSDTFSCFV